MTPWQGAARPRDLAAEHFAQAAARLGCESAAIRAVWEVEAAGKHFRPDGSVERRFEPHHFPQRHWPAIGYHPENPGAAVIARSVARFNTSSPRPWQVSVLVSSEPMFQAAARIDIAAACRASSWGAPQIMGFNHSEAGFDSAVEMVHHMAEGAPEQLGAFVQLVEGWGIAGAIRAHDWAAFARRYNGSGQVEHYARLIEAAYRKHSGQRSPVVLRVGARGAAVAELQRALRIEDDGAFGPATLAAVRAFQASAGLPVDGIVGARTWAALTEGRPQPGTEAVAHARYPAPVPPSQPTRADAAAERVTEWGAAAGAVSAAVAGVSQALPEDAVTLVVAGAVALGVLAGAAWVFRRARA